MEGRKLQRGTKWKLKDGKVDLLWKFGKARKKDNPQGLSIRCIWAPAMTVVCGFETCLRVSARIPPSPERERREQSINYIGGSIYHHLPSPLSGGGDTVGENSQTRFGAAGGRHVSSFCGFGVARAREKGTFALSIFPAPDGSSGTVRGRRNASCASSPPPPLSPSHRVRIVKSLVPLFPEGKKKSSIRRNPGPTSSLFPFPGSRKRSATKAPLCLIPSLFLWGEKIGRGRKGICVVSGCRKMGTEKQSFMKLLVVLCARKAFYRWSPVAAKSQNNLEKALSSLYPLYEIALIATVQSVQQRVYISWTEKRSRKGGGKGKK